MTEFAQPSIPIAQRQAASMLVGTARDTGAALFQSLVGRLGEELSLQLCYLAELAEGETGMMRTHAVWTGGRFAEGVAYRLAGTAGEPAIQQGRCHSSSNVLVEFPGDEILRGLEATRFVASPLLNRQGEPIGLLALVPGAASPGTDCLEVILETLSPRAGSELERTQVERRLQASESWFRAMVNSGPALTIVLNSDGRLQFASPLCEKLTGHRPKDLIGQSVLRFLHPDDQPAAMALLTELFLRHEPGPLFPCRIQHRDGSWCRFEVQGNPMRDGEGRDQLVIHCWDLAQRSGSNPSSIQGPRAGAFPSSAAHEFRNLLSPILAHAQIVKGHLPFDHPGQSNLDAVLTSASHAGRLIAQMVTAGQPGPLGQPVVPLGRVVADALPLLRVSLPDWVEVETNLSTEPGLVQADTAQIHQVLLDLCNNAVQDMVVQERGWIEIGVHTAQVTPAAAFASDLRPGAQVILTIRDNGGRRTDGLVPTTGTGQPDPGLATVRSIVRQHLGNIPVSSEPGFANTFRIHLPAVVVGPAPEIAPLPKAGSAHGLEGRRLLLVDDEEPLLFLLKSALTEAGAEVTARLNAQEALHSIVQSTAPFDVIVADLNLPGMSGCAFGRAVRELDRHARIVLTTACSRPLISSEVEALGNATLIEKPLFVADFAGRIESALRARP